MINYIVVTRGHIAFFTRFVDALSFAVEFDGEFINLWQVRDVALRRLQG